MYQTIEDDLQEDVQPPKGLSRPVIITAGGVLFLSVTLAAALLRSAPVTVTSDPIGPEPVARAAYLQALGEADPALRRARLTDYLSQHPGSARDAAVRAQLSVLDAAADRDWQATLTTAYDPRTDLNTRRRAVDAYHDKWGRYLGARDAEIETLRAEIETLKTLDALPDRTLPRDPERYRGVPDDRLVGDRFGTEPRVIFRPSIETRPDSALRNGDVVGVRVRRNAAPRYPRSAERRGVEAIVTLSLTVDERGRVSVVDVIDVEAARYADEFVRAAERAALRTRFDPRTVGGVPIETSGIRKRYRFELGR